MTAWQPIETAPKDGTAILIWQSDKKSYNEWNGHRYDNPHYAIGYWRTCDSPGSWGNRNDAFVKPTHWMPLPEPPDAT